MCVAYFGQFVRDKVSSHTFSVLTCLKVENCQWNLVLKVKYIRTESPIRKLIHQHRQLKQTSLLCWAWNLCSWYKWSYSIVTWCIDHFNWMQIAKKSIKTRSPQNISYSVDCKSEFSTFSEYKLCLWRCDVPIMTFIFWRATVGWEWDTVCPLVIITGTACVCEPHTLFLRWSVQRFCVFLSSLNLCSLNVCAHELCP